MPSKHLTLREQAESAWTSLNSSMQPQTADNTTLCRYTQRACAPCWLSFARLFGSHSKTE